MKLFEAEFQIGKKGLTPEAINSFATALKTHRQLRISMLKSSGRNREIVKQTALEIKQRMPHHCAYKIIGFTIILTKHKKHLI